MNQTSRSQGYFPGSFFNRSDRLLMNEQGYHYQTREGKAMGPFPNKTTALLNLESYIRNKTNA